MSRSVLINLIEGYFPPNVTRAILKDLYGVDLKAVALAAEIAVTLDFSEHKFFSLTLGSANITLNAKVTGLIMGEKVYLKITQDATAARTITWGTGILTDVTVTASTDAIDMLIGIFDGTNIIFGALAKNVV